MDLLRDGVDRVPEGTATAVSVGSYDGIHRGHRTVLSTVRELAGERGLDPAVVSFDQHPAAVVNPDAAPLLLTDHEQRMELFADVGVRWLYLLRFDEARAATTSEEFVEQVLVGALNAKLVVVGSDFHFGKGRSGSVESLAEMGENLGFEVVSLDLLGSEDGIDKISSTAIRSALAEGDVESVNAMLGRRYEVRGAVVQGDQRGRQIGFPTANIAYEAGRAWPANGVYAAWTELDDGRREPTVVNIGLRPTFYDNAEWPLLEAHLLDFDGDLYGQVLRVEFEARLRAERRFSGIDEIRQQLATDVEAARAALQGG